MNYGGYQISMIFKFYGHMLKSGLTGPLATQFKLHTLRLPKCRISNCRWGRPINRSGFEERWRMFRSAFWTCQIWEVYETSKWRQKIVIWERRMDRKVNFKIHTDVVLQLPETECVIKETRAAWDKKRIMDWTWRHHNNKGSGRGKDWEGATNKIRGQLRGYGVVEVRWRTYIWEGNEKLWHLLLISQVRCGLRLYHLLYLYENEQNGWWGPDGNGCKWDRKEIWEKNSSWQGNWDRVKVFVLAEWERELNKEVKHECRGVADSTRLGSMGTDTS